MSQKKDEVKWWKYLRITVIVLLEIGFIIGIIAAINQPRVVLDCSHNAIAQNPFGDMFRVNMSGNNITIHYEKNENVSTLERAAYALGVDTESEQ